MSRRLEEVRADAVDLVKALGWALWSMAREVKVIATSPAWATAMLLVALAIIGVLAVR